jgi:hypothetical protein
MAEDWRITNRRKRVARRIFKRAPLFAVELMIDQGYNDYSPQMLAEDLPLKNKPRPKFKKPVKVSPKRKYALKFKALFELTCNVQHAYTYNSLMRNLAAPWRVRGNRKAGIEDRTYSNQIASGIIAQLAQAVAQSHSRQEFEEKEMETF